MSYEIKPISAPRATGTLLRLLCRLVESPLTGPLVGNSLLKSAGVQGLREYPCDSPPWSPLALRPDAPPWTPGWRPNPDELPSGTGLPGGSDFVRSCAADYVAAYRAGSTTPEQIAERIIEAIRAADNATPPLRAFISQNPDDLVEQARASAQRYRDGTSLGPLDGVPVAVKDELDVAGYPTTVGTRFLGTEKACSDAHAVALLRQAGALLIGKTNMHEIGLGVTGLNPHHGSARNPYDPSRATGGSSSGSAAAVSAGLCPIAVGADGGGSIRIPAAFCGVWGLKPTFGRVSERGVAPVCWSVAHLGPIAGSLEDLALGYAFMAGPDRVDPMSCQQPQPRFDQLSKPGIDGVRLGVFRQWNELALPEVRAACNGLVTQLEAAGATIVELSLPELALVQSVHLVTIVSEMAAAHLHLYDAHRFDYGLDVRLNLALGRRLTNRDYVHAQRVRTRLAGHFAGALSEVDAIVTPTTGCTAPALAEDALHCGESNLTVLSVIMLYAQAANLTGFPALSMPAGYDEQGLPVGLHLLGKPWEEDLLMRIGAAAQTFVSQRRPKLYWEPLAE